jgi:hypothetical protein
MANDGSTSERREERAVSQWGGGLVLGMIIGAAIGAAVGLVFGAVAFGGGAALWTSAIGGAIFGGLAGAFMGGMSRLEDPPPGEEPGVRERPLERQGLTHDEQER